MPKTSGVEEAKIPSIKKAWEIADTVVAKYMTLELEGEVPNQGFGKKDDNTLIVNKAIKEMVKQDPELAVEEITAEDVFRHLLGKPGHNVQKPRTWWEFFSKAFSAMSCYNDGR